VSTTDHKMGVALTRCYFCGEADRIVLNTRLTEHLAKQVEEMNGKVMDLEPCAKCAGYMSKGILLLTIDPEKSELEWDKSPLPNPYRTGGFFVVTDDAISRMLPEGKLRDYALKTRWMFIAHEAAERIGLFKAGAL
jgi:hypothetical protein